MISGCGCRITFGEVRALRLRKVGSDSSRFSGYSTTVAALLKYWLQVVPRMLLGGGCGREKAGTVPILMEG